MIWIVLLTVLCILLILLCAMQHLQLKNAEKFMNLYWRRQHEIQQELHQQQHPQVVMSEVIHEEEPPPAYNHEVATTLNGLQVGPDGVTYTDEPERRGLARWLRGK